MAFELVCRELVDWKTELKPDRDHELKTIECS